MLTQFLMAQTAGTVDNSGWFYRSLTPLSRCSLLGTSPVEQTTEIPNCEPQKLRAPIVGNRRPCLEQLIDHAKLVRNLAFALYSSLSPSIRGVSSIVGAIMFSVLNPALSRTPDSISNAICGLSFRNWRAFSRPCPKR